MVEKKKVGEKKPVTIKTFGSLVEYSIACRALVEFLFLSLEERGLVPTGEERFRMLDQIFEDTTAAYLEGGLSPCEKASPE